MSRTISIKKTTFKNFNFSNFLKPKQTTTLKVNVDTSFALPNTNTMDDGLINFNIDIKPFDGSNLFSLSLHASFIMSWNEQVDLEAAKQIMSEAALPVAYTELSRRLREIMLNLELAPIELPEEFINKNQ